MVIKANQTLLRKLRSSLENHGLILSSKILKSIDIKYKS